MRTQLPTLSLPPHGARDRVIDLLRGASLAVVVAGHVLMAVVVWDDGVPRIDNVLTLVPPLRLATWVLQVMPLFFAAGAVANRIGLRSAAARGEPWRVWVWGRVRRLVRPVLPYLAIWVPLVFVLTATLPAAAPLSRLSTQLLWFLGVYVVIVATSSWQRRVARFGLGGVAVLVALVAVIDVVRFHGRGDVATVNFFLVWFIAATLGLIVRDWPPPHRGRLWFVSIGAVAGNALLVCVGPYPLSMVGLPGERMSNMAPPTLVLCLHAVALIAAVGASWSALERACDHPRVWRAVQGLGSVALTLYLWHLTVLIVVVIAEHWLGLERPGVSDPWFWPATAVHVAIVVLGVIPVVRAMTALERRPIPWLEGVRTPVHGSAYRTAAAATGILVLGVAFLVLAATGMDGFPFAHATPYAGLSLTPGLGFLLLALGVLLARFGGRPESARRGRPFSEPATSA